MCGAWDPFLWKVFRSFAFLAYHLVYFICKPIILIIKDDLFKNKFCSLQKTSTSQQDNKATSKYSWFILGDWSRISRFYTQLMPFWQISKLRLEKVNVCFLVANFVLYTGFRAILENEAFFQKFRENLEKSGKKQKKL